jgi:hypothetical protein
MISFHPVDVDLFDDLLGALSAGRRVRPDPFLDRACNLRRTCADARRHASGVEQVLDAAGPAKPRPGAGWIRNLRTRLEAFDYRPDEATRLLCGTVMPDLHIHGRPFLITETSAEKVAEAVDAYCESRDGASVDRLARAQLARLDLKLPDLIQPVDSAALSPDLLYRRDLLAQLTVLHDLGCAAREGKEWDRAGEERRPAIEVLCEELPWLCLSLHARAVPFWIGRDGEGLETLCREAGVESPDVLVPARRLFAEAIDEFPSLQETFRLEIDGPRRLGAFAAPPDIPQLLDFLNERGARLIAAAAQRGEGPACTLLLRKIKECATYAAKHGWGYLESSGLQPADLEDEIPAEALAAKAH